MFLYKTHFIRRLKYRLGFYKKRSKKRGKKEKNSKFVIGIIIYGLIIAVTAGIIFYGIRSRVSSLSVSMCQSEIKNELNLKCSQRINNLIAEKGIKYSDFVQKEYKEGGISGLAVDFTKLNDIKNTIAEDINGFLALKKDFICYIPVGAIVSDEVFAAYGFKIPTKVITTAWAEVNFDEDFMSAGINQIKHRLTINVSVTANLHTVFKNYTMDINIQIPMAETIISGEVPVLGTDGLYNR